MVFASRATRSIPSYRFSKRSIQKRGSGITRAKAHNFQVLWFFADLKGPRFRRPAGVSPACKLATLEGTWSNSGGIYERAKGRAAKLPLLVLEQDLTMTYDDLATVSERAG
jgi:hypothetical protein